MLSSNNMLTTGGNRRQRARGTVRVNEPAYGFFIAGSSIEAMNGVYIRRNPPRVPIRDDAPPMALFYEHEEGGWRMALNSLCEDEEEEEEDEEDYYYHYRPKPKKPTHEWVFIDELDKERFAHEGDTIVPGAGTRWKHQKKKEPSPSAAGGKMDACSLDSSSDSEGGMESFMSPYQMEAEEAAPDPCATSTSTAVAEVKPDDMDELPWQVIAILDIDMVQQLVYSSRHRKQKVRDAKAGKNAPAPHRASLEATALPGKWLFRVVAADGVILRSSPDDSGDEVGTRRFGEYLRGVELAVGGDWLRLEASEDTRPLSRQDRFYNTEHSRRPVWVRVCTDGADTLSGSMFTYLEEVPADDTAVLNLKGLSDVVLSDVDTLSANAEPHGGSGLTGDLFDRPFVPRMEGADNSGAAEAEQSVLKEGEDPALLAVKSAMGSAQWHGVPIGSLVEVAGLRSRSGMAYNGVTGVVVAAIDPATGCQGVRLDAPYSGKILACKPQHLVYIEGEDESDTTGITGACNVLGLKLSQLGLQDQDSKPSSDAWGFAGNTAADRVGCALRSALRDVGTNFAASAGLRDSAEILLKELAARNISHVQIKPTDQMAGLPPEAMLRAGALGPRAAAAVVSAMSPLSTEEQAAGVNALKELISEERVRDRAAAASIMDAPGEDSQGGDELLLRLALVQTLLDGRREAEALEEARYAAKFHELTSVGPTESSPAVSFLLARCLLRLGIRAEGLTTLEKAEKKSCADMEVELSCRPDWLLPVCLWGTQEAGKLLVSHRAAERCINAAVETYSRGSFDDAAALYSRALGLLQAGCSDDKRGRAAVLTDRAGCLRRARRLEDAVSDLDAALRLFPRYTRALFRRAACLLECGKADMAVDAFKDLYRVDRDWPNLSEWLVRAYSLRKRQAKGYKGGVEYEEPAAAPGAGNKDGDAIATEVCHYTVLGVSTDASEKQLKTAYRMRSLQFHPDRKAGNTGAFQRIAEAYEILSDPDKRRAYDEGGDIKVKRGRRDEDDDSEDDEEEHKTSMREEVEREFYPERYSYWPFGDPFIYKRKLEAQKKNKESSKPSWQSDGW